MRCRLMWTRGRCKSTAASRLATSARSGRCRLAAQEAADACAVSAIIAGMKKHSGDAAVAEYGCFAIGNICRAVGNKSDTDAERALAEEGKARKEAAVDAGALGVIVNAALLRQGAGVQQWGARALSNITYGSSE